MPKSYFIKFNHTRDMCGITSHGIRGADRKPLPQGHWPDHFRPSSAMFPPKMKWKVIASDIGCAITMSVLGYCAWMYGFRAVWFWYVGPYFWIHAFLVWVSTRTMQQHGLAKFWMRWNVCYCMHCGCDLTFYVPCYRYCNNRSLGCNMPMPLFLILMNKTGRG